MMNCKTAQRQMALAVGEDLPPAEIQEVQSHLQDCSKCQQTWEQHQRGFAVLQHSRTNETRPNRDSVWPSLSGRLRERAAAPQRGEFNGWIAALAVTAASVLIFVFSQDDSAISTARSPHTSIQGGTNVASPSGLRGSASSAPRRDGIQTARPYNADPRPVADRP
jgi:anti-sigma factor RsiW